MLLCCPRTLLTHSAALSLLFLLCGPPRTAVAAMSPQAESAVADSEKHSDARKGQKFIVIEAGAELKTPDAVVWRSYPGEIFTASLTNGEWLWISEKGGWLWEQHTVPFETAVSELSARISKDATAENYHLRGIAYVAHTDYDKAVADFSESLKRKPNTAGVLNNRGQACYLKKDYDAAIADLSAAIKAEPKHFVAMNNRALAYIAKEQLNKALTDLNAAVALNKEYPEALNNRGVVYSRTGRFDAAVADFTAALKIHGDYIDAYGNRSFAYRQLGKYQEAIADLRLSMEKSPLDYKPVNDLAWILATAENKNFRDPKQAIAEATRACEMTQYTNWNTLDTLATAYAAAGQKDKALEWITTAIEHAPENHRKRLREHRELMDKGQRIPQ